MDWRQTSRGTLSVVRRIIVLLAVSALALGILFVSGCAWLHSRGSRVTSPTGGVEQVPAAVCPIDGLPISESFHNERPLAVMVENSPDARPQSGLNDACVVYEGITEGGITRFMAVYHHALPTLIGPVRSARPHFIHLSREYDAALVHCGQSYEALQIFAETPRIYNLDQMKYDKPFWRDHSRVAPHNLYTSGVKLVALMHDEHWGGVPDHLPQFYSASTLTSGDAADSLDIDFHGAVKYRLRFVYDAARGGYVRYMDGKLQTDRETGEPPVAKNIIIQRVFEQQYPESTLHTYDVNVINNGDGLFISNQHQTPLRWNKLMSDTPTGYTGADGAPLPYMPGQTWIELVPLNGSVTIHGPQPTAPPTTPAHRGH